MWHTPFRHLHENLFIAFNHEQLPDRFNFILLDHSLNIHFELPTADLYVFTIIWPTKIRSELVFVVVSLWTTKQDQEISKRSWTWVRERYDFIIADIPYSCLYYKTKLRMKWFASNYHKYEVSIIFLGLNPREFFLNKSQNLMTCKYSTTTTT